MADDVEAKQVLESALTVPEDIDHPAALVDRLHVGVNQNCRRMGFECPDRRADCARQIEVIRVEPGDDLPVRMGKPLVDGLGLPAVLLADPPGQPVCILLDDLHAAVGRTAIDDDVLDVVIVLLQDGKHGLPEEGRLIE